MFIKVPKRNNFKLKAHLFAAYLRSIPTMKSTSFLLGGLLACIVESASIPHYIHQKRQFQSPDWIEQGTRPQKDANIPLALALTQQNLHLGPESLMSISDPTSTNFGKHWTAQEVRSFSIKSLMVQILISDRSWTLLPHLTPPLTQ
jgi:tripeptidyl-peptidase-1